MSYSHRDEAVARKLHRQLETYRVPRSLVGTTTAVGTVPRRLFPVFRDREELPTSADLGGNVRGALEASRALIVLCSPAAAASHWVNEEVLAFKRLGRPDRVFALIVDGEPNAADGKSGVDPTAECFPHALRHAVNLDGELSGARAEPVAADLRSGKDRWDNAKLKLVAGLLGVGFDALWQRDRVRRRWRIASTIVGVAAVLLSAVGLWQVQEAAKRFALSQGAVVQASRSREAGREMEGLAYLARAIRTAPGNDTARLLALGACLADETPRLVLVARHQDEVTDAAFSADGTRVVTASMDHTAQVWDAQTGAAVGAPLRHDDWVMSAAFSADGTLVVTASNDHTARVWDARTGAALGAPLQHDDKVTSAAFSADGTRVVTASNDRTAQVWDARTGAAVGAPLRHDGAVWSATFSADGTRVVTASYDRTARVWDAWTGAAVGAPLSHANVVYSAAFSADGTRVVTASGDNTARVWDAQSGAAMGVPLQHDALVTSAVFSTDGTRVATASDDHTA
ncbi:MAG TPA: TIR domain-containing protein, partial [Candidatus Binatia bacterium]|nr:TIR domain-containing protein [Candidatus Binatia bacterium]